MSPFLKWYRLSFRDRFLLFKTFLILVGIRLGLFLMPLKNFRRFLRWTATTSPVKSDHRDQDLGKAIWAIASVGKYILGDGPCLTQALAAQQLLIRHNRQSELCIGVAKDSRGKLVAHAWVESDGVVIIGGSEDSVKQYTKLPSLEEKLF
jgi:hypothetical protein